MHNNSFVPAQILLKTVITTKWVCTALILASTAFATPPAYAQSQPCFFGNACPANCTVPAVIVGTLSGARVGSGFVVTVRDDSNQPVPNRYVKVDFTNSAIIPKAMQVFPTYNDCGGGHYRIMQSTNTNGQVTIDAAITGFSNSTNVDVYCRIGHRIADSARPHQGSLNRLRDRVVAQRNQRACQTIPILAMLMARTRKKQISTLMERLGSET
jgi:hypothetical protein